MASPARLSLRGNLRSNILRRHIITYALAALLMAGMPSFVGTQASAFSLTTVHADIEDDYPGVQHLSPEGLTRSLGQDAGNIILFDVRAPDEFKVSRLKNAIRVDPSISAGDFFMKFAKTLPGKTVVFYCSVGLRSSRLAYRLQEHLVRDGANGTYNLQGGIFNWHNEQRPLHDAKGKTNLVHPYDRKWGKLVTRRDLTSYTPKERKKN